MPGAPPVERTRFDRADDVRPLVPRVLRVSAALGWRLLVVVAANVRTRVDVAGRRGVAALVSYVRATAAVAVVDAIAIGIGLGVLGVPLAVPLAALVFLGASVPNIGAVIGAVMGGGVAVLVALVANGPVAALIVLGIIVAVMQLEAHVLQPLLLGAR
jgi:predicted PurR-regulated permease PerM